MTIVCQHTSFELDDYVAVDTTGKIISIIDSPIINEETDEEYYMIYITGDEKAFEKIQDFIETKKLVCLGFYPKNKVVEIFEDIMDAINLGEKLFRMPSMKNNH